jgi:hypothetical protein
LSSRTTLAASCDGPQAHDQAHLRRRDRDRLQQEAALLAEVGDDRAQRERALADEHRRLAARAPRQVVVQPGDADGLPRALAQAIGNVVARAERNEGRRGDGESDGRHGVLLEVARGLSERLCSRCAF